MQRLTTTRLRWASLRVKRYKPEIPQTPSIFSSPLALIFRHSQCHITQDMSIYEKVSVMHEGHGEVFGTVQVAQDVQLRALS